MLIDSICDSEMFIDVNLMKNNAMKSLQKINNELIKIFLKIPFSKFKPFN